MQVTEQQGDSMVGRAGLEPATYGLKVGGNLPADHGLTSHRSREPGRRNRATARARGGHVGRLAAVLCALALAGQAAAAAPEGAVCTVPESGQPWDEVCYARAQVADVRECGGWVTISLASGARVSWPFVARMRPSLPPGHPGAGRVVYVTTLFAGGFECCVDDVRPPK